ncbi:hemerythrin domain-containing protein [Saccharomonospora sp. NPDC046836]|uniref:hemerythrin domain-containing protein n=1 Tax=Saccharomonospora sp. NPDC046836 TaxID=3156921 RepID=UPI0033FF3E4F
MSARPDTMPETDVIELLLHQHREIRRLFTRVQKATPQDRGEAFDRLRRFLALHETAEEMVLHPDARKALADGDRVIDARLAEEKHAGEMVAELEQLGPDDEGFLPALAQLKKALFEHAGREERTEFPEMRKAHEKARLTELGRTVKAAEATPLTGSYAAMVDRSRDVLRQAAQQFSDGD